MKGVEHGSILQSIDIDTIPTDFAGDGGSYELLDTKDQRSNFKIVKSSPKTSHGMYRRSV